MERAKAEKGVHGQELYLEAFTEIPGFVQSLRTPRHAGLSAAALYAPHMGAQAAARQAHSAEHPVGRGGGRGGGRTAAASRAGGHHHRRRQRALRGTPPSGPALGAPWPAPPRCALRPRQATRRRASSLWASSRVHHVGMGISGGAEGARHGPSLMLGGTPEAYAALAPVLAAMAAKAPCGEPCVALVGPDGAGHFVKMVHNGIEYADMGAIAEAYDMLTTLGRLSASQAADALERLNAGRLRCYLLEISARLLRVPDRDSPACVPPAPLVERVLDQARGADSQGQEPRGALSLSFDDAGCRLRARAPASGLCSWPRTWASRRPASAPRWRLVTAAPKRRAWVARLGGTAQRAGLCAVPWSHASAGHGQALRVALAASLRGSAPLPAASSTAPPELEELLSSLEEALYAAKVVAYSQGFDILSAASQAYGWALDHAAIAKLWCGRDASSLARRSRAPDTRLCVAGGRAASSVPRFWMPSWMPTSKSRACPRCWRQAP